MPITGIILTNFNRPISLTNNSVRPLKGTINHKFAARFGADIKVLQGQGLTALIPVLSRAEANNGIYFIGENNATS